MSQTASLALKTSDLAFGSTTSVGTADSTETSFTWNNIKLRLLLGDMHDQYDRFNLILNTIATGFADVIETTTIYRCTYVTICGLPWTSNAYN